MVEIINNLDGLMYELMRLYNILLQILIIHVNYSKKKNYFVNFQLKASFRAFNLLAIYNIIYLIFDKLRFNVKKGSL